ncbi:MAG: DUF302 domain-containing protein [Candidatus Eisenbacteria bacterium]
MDYYFAKELELTFDEAVRAVTDALSREGFGVLTQIDVKATLKDKLDVDFREYRILGACNPPLAHRALMSEKWIGIMLPCNVVVQETETGTVEVAAVDPLAAMASVDNSELGPVAQEAQGKLRAVIENL